ncbi:MAG: restriction endonuclease subunit S [Nitrososphaera sp.]|nr:restriction endonuclease subunit S [Nitrososphaera sp.]
MSTWQTKPLSELLTLLENGSRPRGGVSLFTEGIPSIGGEHLNNDGGFDFDGIKFVPEIFFQQMGRGLIQQDDVLLVKDGATTGKTAFIGADFPYQRAAINEHVFILRANRKLVLPRYLFFFLFGPWGQAQILACFRGAAIGGIGQDFARSVDVPVPPLAEQERIVRILDEAETLHRQHAQAEERMSQFVPALFYETFGNPMNNENEWPTKPLGELLDRIDSGQSPVCLDRQALEDEWAVLKLSAITSGVYLEHENKALPDNFSPDPNLEIKEKDVLFSRKNTRDLVAACVLVWHTRPRLMLSDLTFRFRISSEGLVLPEYLWATLASKVKRKQIQMLASGAAANMPNISKEKLQHVEILVPPISLQRAFAGRIADAQVLESSQAASRQRLDDLFQSLLHRAFQGGL